jgi:MFS family permease
MSSDNTAPEIANGRVPHARIFYGWWIVAACLAATMIGNALGLYGAGVYLHAVTETRGWSTGLVSGAVTLFHVVGAFLLVLVGSSIGRFGPRPAIGLGALAMASGVAGIGRVEEPWQAYAAFLAMGIGWSCLTMTSVSAALAPWFERHYGRAVSTASLGASVGGMAGAPVLFLGVEWFGLPATTTMAAAVAAAVILPLACFVLRRSPLDMGLLPDGEPMPGPPASGGAAARWGRVQALRTAALASVVAAFGLGMMAQIGFLTHQVALVAPALGPPGASGTVAATAAAALLGRLLLVRFADRVDARAVATGVLLLAATALGAMALFPLPEVLVGAGLAYGLTVGNVTTLSAIVVRREFGAASFGAVYGAAPTGIQLAAAVGPGLYGLLHDATGNYDLALLTAAALDIMAAALVLLGGSKPPVPRRVGQ